MLMIWRLKKLQEGDRYPTLVVVNTGVGANKVGEALQQLEALQEDGVGLRLEQMSPKGTHQLITGYYPDGRPSFTWGVLLPADGREQIQALEEFAASNPWVAIPSIL